MKTASVFAGHPRSSICDRLAVAPDDRDPNHLGSWVNRVRARRRA